MITTDKKTQFKNIIAKEVNPISGIRENNRKNLTIYYLKGTEPYN